MEKQQVKKRWYRYLIQLMVVALMVTSIPLNGLAETAPPFTPSPNSEQSPQVEKKEEKGLPAPHPVTKVTFDKKGFPQFKPKITMSLPKS
ncbi:hypothetical protein I6L50_11565 [Bacillus sp. FDAARGOS_1420]|nr:hypothetical protein [Bacillus sp. FDAARGOS_1420]MBW3492686.1 hypothetical protein [Bacillus sp. FDAARGOS_1420]